MTWTDADLALITGSQNALRRMAAGSQRRGESRRHNRMPFRNQTTEWRRLTQADRALLDNLRYSTVITDRDRERLQALAHRLGTYIHDSP